MIAIIITTIAILTVVFASVWFDNNNTPTK